MAKNYFRRESPLENWSAWSAKAKFLSGISSQKGAEVASMFDSGTSRYGKNSHQREYCVPFSEIY